MQVPEAQPPWVHICHTFREVDQGAGRRNVTQPVERVRHVPANWQGPEVPGYKYVYDLPPEQVAKNAADAQAQANTGMATGGGGYQFDPATADEIINDLRDILQWIQREPQRHARALINIPPMGDEVGSTNYVQDGNAAGMTYLSYLNSVETEIQRQIDVLTQAKQAYLDQENQVTDTLKGKHPHNA
jgi:hypothetical protein